MSESQSNKIDEPSAETKQFDLVICGGGLVGLSLANALVKSGLQIAVIDAQKRPQLSPQVVLSLTGFDLKSGYASRVSAINLASKAFLDQLDVWADVKRVCTYQEMFVRDINGTGDIAFNAADIDAEALGYIVENQQILAALANRLDNSNVTMLWETQLEDLDEQDEIVELILKSQVGECIISTGLLVGADGGNSHIRTLANMKTLSWQYGQEALVSTIQTEKPHNNVARQWFTDQGPLAFLPLSEPNLCSIVWSLNDATAYKTYSAETLCQHLTQASDYELGIVEGVDARFCFPLVQQHAYRYVKKHLALIGDAAHTIHPLAGQGANLGFADAQALAIELMQAKFSDDGIGDIKLLQRYEQQRKVHNVLMATVMELIKRTYNTDNPGVNWLRNSGMKLANGNGLLKKMMTKLASGF